MAVEIPKRSVFKASEVCSIAEVQPYVLKSWEAEFPALGKSKGDARVYRRTDVQIVLEIKRLLYEEGLTLGAARRKLDAGQGVDDSGETADESLGDDAREQLNLAKKGLRSILELLSENGSKKKGLFDDEPVSGRGLPKDLSGKKQVKRKAGRKSRVARVPKKKADRA
jgi:DNA-binding transcriptional MerR regulator